MIEHKVHIRRLGSSVLVLFFLPLFRVLMRVPESVGFSVFWLIQQTTKYIQKWELTM